MDKLDLDARLENFSALDQLPDLEIWILYFAVVSQRLAFDVQLTISAASIFVSRLHSKIHIFNCLEFKCDFNINIYFLFF